MVFQNREVISGQFLKTYTADNSLHDTMARKTKAQSDRLDAGVSPGEAAASPPGRFDDDLRAKLRQFFASLAVEIAIGLLIVASVLLTLFELSLETDRLYATQFDQSQFSQSKQTWLHRVSWLNMIITSIFAVELSLRCYAAKSKKLFFRQFWLDILATIPLFRPLRAIRALRFFRLFRLFRLVGVLTRLSSRYPMLFQRRNIDFIVVTGVLIICVLFGTVAMMHFESHAAAASGVKIPEAKQFNLHNSFWYSVYTLFAGEPTPMIPRSVAGRAVTVFIMFMGLTMFVFFAGTMSAVMVNRIRWEGAFVNWEELRGHVIICGWTNKVEVIIQEFRADRNFRDTPIVIIAELDFEPSTLPPDVRKNTVFLQDDFTKVDALEKAGVHRAKACVILADTSKNRSAQDADARTILAALTVEKTNPAIQTSAELLNRDYGSHLDLGRVNSYVISGEYSAFLLAHEAMKKGSINVFDELLSGRTGNQFVRCPIPDEWEGISFDEAVAEVRRSARSILVGILTPDGETLVNPDQYVIQAQDTALLIGIPGTQL